MPNDRAADREPGVRRALFQASGLRYEAWKR
ncbi:hypothetical protein FHS62_001446 [Amphiplicatus metriothermophilus]|nr:hypothetical protein [Amphiplicatus metriothermophilus]